MDVFKKAVTDYFSSHPKSRSKVLFERLAVLLDLALKLELLGPKKMPAIHVERTAHSYATGEPRVLRELRFRYRDFDFGVIARPGPWGVQRFNKGRADHRWIANTYSTVEEAMAGILLMSKEDATPASYDLSESSLSDEDSDEKDLPFKPMDDIDAEEKARVQRVVDLHQDVQDFAWLSNRGYQIVIKLVSNKPMALRFCRIGATDGQDSLLMDKKSVASIIPGYWGSGYAEVSPLAAANPKNAKLVDKWPAVVASKKELGKLLEKMI
jgi:hypothetical protein